MMMQPYIGPAMPVLAAAQPEPEEGGVPGFVVWSMVVLLAGVVGYAVGFDRGGGGAPTRKRD